MSKLPETKVAVLMEKQNWENIIHSEEWIVFRRLLKEHIDYLQNEVNHRLRNFEDRKSGESLRAMDDCKKMLDLVTIRISDLNKASEKGEK